ncbi:hypothetical protein [Aliidiomarina indica]|uniref:hypothetical protein n=1 Tax=Aliidiomarina indica TaxID=2749147 RepID=UPI0018903E84|nr:hypothetical protein [Aliidiomarina indica]
MMPPIRATKAQHGYILVAAALLLTGFAWALFTLTNLARGTQQQTEIQHVADHTAAALGIIAARDLNFKAVTNRAMLANEVAIGQALALLSWYEMARMTSQRLAAYSAWIPYVNTVSAHLARTMQQLRVPITSGVNAYVRFQQIVIQGIEHAQWTFHQAAWLSSVMTAHHIAESSHLKLELFLLNHQTLIDLQTLWFRFQSRKGGTEAQQDYLRMVQDSRDGFTRARTYRWFDTGMIYAQKAGGTDAKARLGQVHWQSIDSLSLHQRALFWRIEHRLGGGGSFIGSRPPMSGRPAGFGDSYQRNRRASHEGARLARSSGGGHRIPRYYEINDARDTQITVVLRSHDGDLKWAASRAKVYFSRPQALWPRPEGMQERANLFNALWQSRLLAVPEYELLILASQVHSHSPRREEAI